MAIRHRYEFVYFFDVINGNPNGDPDAANLPRRDPETGHGLVTDVCLKRKIRNFIALSCNQEKGCDIYIREKSLLNEQNKRAYDALGIKPESKKLPKDEVQAQQVTAWMCQQFFDVRSFGAVMTTGVNSGQVRGPVQLNFARSVDVVVPLEITIARMAVTNERDRAKEQTMGRKYIIPYGLYRVHGFISAKLAEKTGFDDTDLERLKQALCMMFEHDRSATRGEMSARRLIVFKHQHILGNQPAHKLFDGVKVNRVNGISGTPATAFSDYEISVDPTGLSGVSIEEWL